MRPFWAGDLERDDGGTGRSVVVDLWTAEAGHSDMVLKLTVTEADHTYRFELEMIYVP